MSQPGSWAGPPDPQGSIEIWTYEVARRLAARSVRVRVFAPRAGRRRRITLFDGVEYVDVPGGFDRMVRPFTKLLPNRPGRPRNVSVLHYLGYAVQVALELRSFRPDVIHVHNHFPFARLIRPLNRRARLVLHMHGEWLSDLDPDIVGPALAVVDDVVACSEHVASRVRSAWPASTCTSVPNGANPAWLAIAHDRPAEPHILYVGRISPEKGLHDLVDAFTAVAAELPTARLTIIGAQALTPRGSIVDVSSDPRVQALSRFYHLPPYWDQLQRRVPSALRTRVEFLRSIPQRDLREWYTSTTVLVNPSLSESFGMSLVEAMAAGCPVVATCVGGVPEVIEDGVSGTLVPPADVKALAQAILDVCTDVALAARLAEAGRRRVREHFTWDVVADRVEALYTSTPATRAGDGLRRSTPRVLRRAQTVALDALTGRTLVVAAHPDDETLACGGTMSALAARGRETGVVFLTDGGMTGPGRREVTAAARAEEARAAAKVLGVEMSRLWLLGFRDGGLTGDEPQATSALQLVLGEFRPRQIFVPHPRDGHPDHEAAHRITVAALAAHGASAVLYEYPIWLWDRWPWTRPPAPWPPTRQKVRSALRGWRASLVELIRRDLAGMDTRFDVVDRLPAKRAALACYESQLPDLARIGRGRFLQHFDMEHEHFRRVDA